MDIKFTLKLNKEIIEKAKLYEASKQVSLSKLIENYLILITKEPLEKTTPLVDSLSGIIELTSDYNDKDDFSAYLSEKYK